MAPDINCNHKINTSDNESYISETFEDLDYLRTESEDENENDIVSYQLLTQENDLNLNQIETSNEEVCGNIIENSAQSLPFSSFDSPKIENNCKEREASFLMDSEHINKIKTAMSNFVLPSSSIPSWASIISEDEWKCFIMSHNISR